MKRKTLRKICIVLALTGIIPLGLASVSGKTLAYLTDNELITNTITFEQQYQTPVRRDKLNYYYLNKSGNSTQIRDSGYTNVTIEVYHVGEPVCATDNNQNFSAAPNGFKISYIEVRGTTVQAGNCTAHPQPNNVSIDIYFEPITYSIAYDYNGYSENEITFAHTPLQNSYTVFDKIDVPYGNDVQVQGDSLIGWNDQNNVTHTANNATGSWAGAIGTISNTGVYNAFAGRQSGDLVLTAQWQNGSL